ncbi:MAG TPA: RNB domain-containing ribonuclease [Myxococcaceae bacterium]|nr:RNB domain-containing ribonuclease [Myxococcaceae bacterium]
MSEPRSGSFDLLAQARAAMRERGFLPEFSPEVRAEVAGLPAGGPAPAPEVEDLRGLLWSSIDNDESLDLDQIEVGEPLPEGLVRIRVGIADVDASVRAGGPTDAHASTNTTSVYTGVTVFTMLPEALSYERTSLKQDADRSAVVVSFRVHPDGTVDEERVSHALVRNRAKLAYPGLAGWLAGQASVPERVQGVSGLREQLELQERATRALRERRVEQGALDLETIEARPVMADGKIVDLQVLEKSRSRELIEDLMIASNGVMARYLAAQGRSSIARVVRVPRRWDRIVELARGLHATLPAEPDPAALERFLLDQRKQDPLRFPDLSLAVVKLLGPGEYVLQAAGAARTGHFGLAVQDYTHSTAPNRRYADLVTQRLVKAALSGRPPPYDDAELEAVAARCTEMEDGARRVERQVRKMAAALLLRGRIGQVFDGLVTGVSEKGTFARLLLPPAEGRVVRGERGLDVGDRVRLKLLSTDPERGFIDFGRA